MKNILISCFCILLITYLASCEKEIDLEYQHDYDRLVVEAVLLKGQTSHQIKVSREVNYFKTPEFISAEDVQITIEDENGNTGTFYYIDSGYFGLDNYDIDYRTNYTLRLKDGEEVIEASSKTSSKITLDTVLTSTYSENGWNTPGLKLIFQDPGGEDNYYVGNTEINELPQSNNLYNQYRMFTDEFIDGKTNTKIIPTYYESGDTIGFILRSIDYHRYQYIKTFEETNDNGGFFSASPSNPISNFKDKALGYFSVEVEDKMTIVID